MMISGLKQRFAFTGLRTNALLVSVLLVLGLAALPVTAEEPVDEYPEPGQHEALQLQVNINTDDAATLSELLDGVGPTRAEAIVAHREEHGPFDTVDDLLTVSGIGPATLNANRDRVVTDISTSAAQ